MQNGSIEPSSNLLFCWVTADEGPAASKILLAPYGGSDSVPSQSDCPYCTMVGFEEQTIPLARRCMELFAAICVGRRFAIGETVDDDQTPAEIDPIDFQWLA